MLNLTLSIICSGDNATSVASRNYTSLVGGSWWYLETPIPDANSADQHVCRAQFYSSRNHSDEAKNRPTNIEVPCVTDGRGDATTLAPSALFDYSSSGGIRQAHDERSQNSEVQKERGAATTAAPSGLFDHTSSGGIRQAPDERSQNSEVQKETADGNSLAAVWMSAVALIVSVFAIIIILGLLIFIGYILRRRRLNFGRETRECEIGIESPPDSAERSDKGTSTLLDRDASDVNRSAQDLSVQYHADGPTATISTTPVCGGGRSGTGTPKTAACVPVFGGSMESVSSCSISLHDNDGGDESNEKTLLPIDRKQKSLAEAARLIDHH